MNKIDRYVNVLKEFLNDFRLSFARYNIFNKNFDIVVETHNYDPEFSIIFGKRIDNNTYNVVQYDFNVEEDAHGITTTFQDIHIKDFGIVKIPCLGYSIPCLSIENKICPKDVLKVIQQVFQDKTSSLMEKLELFNKYWEYIAGIFEAFTIIITKKSFPYFYTIPIEIDDSKLQLIKDEYKDIVEDISSITIYDPEFEKTMKYRIFILRGFNESEWKLIMTRVEIILAIPLDEKYLEEFRKYFGFEWKNNTLNFSL